VWSIEERYTLERFQLRPAASQLEYALGLRHRPRRGTVGAEDWRSKAERPHMLQELRQAMLLARLRMGLLPPEGPRKASPSVGSRDRSWSYNVLDGMPIPLLHLFPPVVTGTVILSAGGGVSLFLSRAGPICGARTGFAMPKKATTPCPPQRVTGIREPRRSSCRYPPGC
jgi:hypothetical protein